MSAECDCHEWRGTGEIGDWLHPAGVTAKAPARELATDAIWEPGHFEPLWGREKLTALIKAADGISCEHALLATTPMGGTVNLDNGLHRWSIARDPGIKRLPVEMRYDGPQQDPWPYTF